MRVVVQRVKEAKVFVDQNITGEIKKGFLLYVGIHENDTEENVKKMATKIHNLRIFEDENGKMNLNLAHVEGSILAISQFTLYGDTKGNNRPSFILAARPEKANMLYEDLCKQLSMHHKVEKGIFQAHMEVESINDGPVTIIIEI
ncbi:MAG: D-aminoacyl-tRNA deacylase [Acholeplasmataceae bacterium]|jgi:D-tyrosyl-tRNA(Tyr) deacylase|nr:D-aminoacyl-tRNA deacylase [Acholeplasmataceae bacterium]